MFKAAIHGVEVLIYLSSFAFSLYLFIRSSKSSSLVQEGHAPCLGYLKGVRLVGATLFFPHNTQRLYSIFFIGFAAIDPY
jgi:hypothetical protein